MNLQTVTLTMFPFFHRFKFPLINPMGVHTPKWKLFERNFHARAVAYCPAVEEPDTNGNRPQRYRCKFDLWHDGRQGAPGGGSYCVRKWNNLRPNSEEFADLVGLSELVNGNRRSWNLECFMQHSSFCVYSIIFWRVMIRNFQFFYENASRHLKPHDNRVSLYHYTKWVPTNRIDRL